MSSNIKITGNVALPHHQQNGYAHKCFPVRNIARRLKADDGGAWLVEYKTEKQRRLQAIKQHNESAKKKKPKSSPKKVKELTRDYLLKEFHLTEPTGLFSININGKNLYPSRGQKFGEFENVLYIEAGDNKLDFELFRSFPKLEELHLQVNSIIDIAVSHVHFVQLKRIDLSYNQLTNEALLNLGKLQNIKALTLRGCGLKNLHPELSRAYFGANSKAEKKNRFPELEHLDLSENQLTELSTFSCLAGLRKLKTLNLSSNKISGIPHLRLLVSHRHFSASTCTCRSMDEIPILSQEPSNLPDEVSAPNVVKAQEFCGDVVSPVLEESQSQIATAINSNNSSNDVKKADGGVMNNSVGVTVVTIGGEKSETKVVQDNQNYNIHVGESGSESTKQDDVNESVAVETPDGTPGGGTITEGDDTNTPAAVESIDIDDDDDDDDIDECLDIPDDLDIQNLASLRCNTVDEALEVVSSANKISTTVNDEMTSSSRAAAGDGAKSDGERTSKQSTTTGVGGNENHIVSVSVNKQPQTPDDAVVDNQQTGDAPALLEDGGVVLPTLSIVDPLVVDESFLPNDVAHEINFTVGSAHDEPKTQGDDVIDKQLKVPFPSLKMLDISENSIVEDSSLLALTSWPALHDLKLWGNPLITTSNGVPPVIAHHLQKMCGINVHRKSPQPDHMYYSIGPSIAKSAKAYRVKNDLPPIKRNTMMEIEMEIQKAVRKKEESGYCIENGGEGEEGVEGVGEDKEDQGAEEQADDAEGIFMTQVEEGAEVPRPLKEDTNVEKQVETTDDGQDYGELLKIDETYGPESEILIPSSVCGSVQALRQMLKNPLIFKDGNYNRSRLLETAPQSQKSKTQDAQLAMSKKNDDVIEDALDVIRNKEATYYENLETVLDSFGEKGDTREKFPDAKKIVKRVQEKYDKVRMESLRPISVAQNGEMSRRSTRADKHSQDLILLRMRQGKIGDMFSGRTTSIPRSRVSTRKESRAKSLL